MVKIALACGLIAAGICPDLFSRFTQEQEALQATSQNVSQESEQDTPKSFDGRVGDIPITFASIEAVEGPAVEETENCLCENCDCENCICKSETQPTTTSTPASSAGSYSGSVGSYASYASKSYSASSAGSYGSQRAYTSSAGSSGATTTYYEVVESEPQVVHYASYEGPRPFADVRSRMAARREDRQSRRAGRRAAWFGQSSRGHATSVGTVSTACETCR